MAERNLQHKTNWQLSETVKPEDLNRIEKNNEIINSRVDENIKKIQAKTSIEVCDKIPAKREENTFYFKVTSTQSGGNGLTDEIKVSPNMGLKII